jgi:hypothetical protein
MVPGTRRTTRISRVLGICPACWHPQWDKDTDHLARRLRRRSVHIALWISDGTPVRTAKPRLILGKLDSLQSLLDATYLPHRTAILPASCYCTPAWALSGPETYRDCSALSRHNDQCSSVHRHVGLDSRHSRQLPLWGNTALLVSDPVAGLEYWLGDAVLFRVSVPNAICSSVWLLGHDLSCYGFRRDWIVDRTRTIQQLPRAVFFTTAVTPFPAGNVVGSRNTWPG